jgi:hypothetical protein
MLSRGRKVALNAGAESLCCNAKVLENSMTTLTRPVRTTRVSLGPFRAALTGLGAAFAVSAAARRHVAPSPDDLRALGIDPLAFARATRRA